MAGCTDEFFARPVRVMLAKAQDTIPGPAALPGGTIWELKYDGYRMVVSATEFGVVLWSRSGSDLTTTFPDLAAAASEQVPAGMMLDGEAVVWMDGRLDFDQLQQRMGSNRSAVARLAARHPASFVAFDVLAVGGVDVRPRPWRERRLLLETLAVSFEPPFQLSPYTEDLETARQWFADYPIAGIEGLVAKGAGSPYRPDTRGWVKVKSRSSVDGIVGAVIGPLNRPEALVVGRYTQPGVLVIVGRTTALTTAQSAHIGEPLRSAPAGRHPWPAQIGSGYFGGGPVAITRVAPEVVVEVSADTALQAGRHRHALRLLRIRPDIEPAELDITGDTASPE